jgi:hypothetical protein
VNLMIYHQLVLRLRMHGTLPSHPLHNFTLCYLGTFGKFG